MSLYARRLKCWIDCAVVILLAPIWLALMTIISVVLLLAQGRPIFFFQERSGLHGQPFQIIKFRTMTNEERRGAFISAEVTKAGRVLRKYSLDELPSLINIARGEMALVGPRPFLHSYLSAYTERQIERFSVRPGLTGLHQVSARNECSWSTKFRYDYVYLANMSFCLDLLILLRTARVVLVPAGIEGLGSTKFNKED